MCTPSRDLRPARKQPNSPSSHCIPLILPPRTPQTATHDDNNSVGDKPPPGDFEALSFWAGRLLLLLAPDGGEGRLRDALMAARSTLRRFEDVLLPPLRGRVEAAGACAVM